MSYKTTCSECQSNNFYVTEHNGLGYCFSCGYTERTKEQVQEKESPHVDAYRLLYKQAAHYYHSCLSTEHRNYLYERGLTDSTIQKQMIGYVPFDSQPWDILPIAEDAGLSRQHKPFLAGRIVFPYFLGDSVVDIRGRAFYDQPEKYLSLYRSGTYRGASVCYNIDTHADTLVIAEGEMKALVPSQEIREYAFHSLPGILSNRMISTKQYKRAIILFDNQVQHIKEVHKAIMKLAKRIHNPYVATLPLRKEKKQDIDSYMLRYGIQALKTVLNNAGTFTDWSRLHGYRV
jgi:hypothetical protein